MKHEIIGKKFERLTVIEDSGERAKNGGVIWKCRCDCGNFKLIRGDSLKDGFTKSCGCLNKEKANKEKAKEVWKTMIKEYLSKEAVEGTILSTIKSTRKVNKNNTSGTKGISWNKDKKKWDAKIQFKGKGIYLGRFSNKQDAINARLKAEEKYFEPILKKYNF